MFRRTWMFLTIMILALAALGVPVVALAQEAGPTPTAMPISEPLLVYTLYPSQVVGLGETVSLDLTLKSGKGPQTVKLEVSQAPEGWNATFRGDGRIVNSIFVDGVSESGVQLRIEQPAEAKPGEYTFTIVATSDVTKVELPVQLTVQEKTPPKLTMTVELPTLKGLPTTTFRYNVSLKNEGNDDQTVNLVAESPDIFQVTFSLAGQDVTNFPVAGNETKRLSVSVTPVGDVQAGSYPITLRAQGADAEATLDLTAEVTGQATIEVTAPDGRLSAQGNAGQESPVKVLLKNTGTAPARMIELSSSEPSGWTVTFDPAKVEELPAGQQIEVTAKIKPADKAVAGDYMVTVNARPGDGLAQSADFRITVLTSTLWGVVGIALIAVALGVVALAVVRFGRR